jgi:regulator of replication initiation timing
LFRRWSDARSTWDIEARDAVDFVLGNHFTKEESSALQSVGQADFVIDRVYAAVDKLKSLLTAQPARFNAIGREDSDNKLANVWKTVLEYVWDISKGDSVFKQVVHDYAVTGLGYMYVYMDPESDYGRGEIKYTHIDPFRVYVDPASRDRFFSDAAGMILSTFLTKEQLLDLYPELEEVIDDIEVGTSTLYGEDYPTSNLKNTQNVITPAEAKNLDNKVNQKYQILDRFYKVRVPFYRIFDLSQGNEKIVDQETLDNLMQDPEVLEALEMGMIEITDIMQTRIQQCSTIGNILLFERTLNTDIYPLVPFANIWTNTPYPKSDVNKVKDSQRLLNKLFSLTLSHAQSSAGLKLLIPEGSVDSVSQLEKDWANPNAVIEYNPEFGEPHFPQPAPLASEFYYLIDRIEKYIDLNFGIPELLQGFKDQAPESVRGTMLLSEMGESRGKSKLRDIETSLAQVGQVIYNLSKEHYKFEKTFKIVQPNNDLTEFTVNNRMYDDKTSELMSIQNDLTLGQHDIRIISGSTLPSNKVAEYNMYLEAYKLNLVDDVEVLKKSEIFDKEGVLQRKSQISQLKSYVAQLEDQVKNLKGDLQTSEREAVNARKRVETEKFKTQLGDVLQQSKVKQAGKTLQLTQAIDNIKSENEGNNK